MSLIEADIDRDLTFRITGEYEPGVKDESVGYHSDGDVEDVKVYLGKINITSQLNDQELDWFKNEFLDYCEECVGG